MKKIQNMDTAQLIYKQDRINQGDLKALAENIKTYGLQHPLLITQKNGKYDIIDGRRRLEACKIAGFKDVPCIVLTKNEANGDLSLILNTHRLNLGPVELYKMAARYVKDELKGDPLALPPEKIRAVAAKLNLDKNATYRILSIGRMAKEVRELLNDNKLPFSLALITITLKDIPTRQRFCKMCLEERPTTRRAIEWLNFSMSGGKKPFKNLNAAQFDTEACDTCRYRGSRDSSLFDELDQKNDDNDNCCWNPDCYNKKTKVAWKEAMKEAKEKLGLTGITQASSQIQDWRYLAYNTIVPTKPDKCKTCKQVKLMWSSSDGIHAICPESCSNIKQKKRSSDGITKPKKKDPAKFTKEDKIHILEERFALAARKAMLEHFIIVTKEKMSNCEVTYYSFRKKPTNYKRVLVFVGFDKSQNPFSMLRVWPSDFVDGEFIDKEAKNHAKIIRTLDLRTLAQLNVEAAAEHLSSLDRSGVTPGRIDVAIQVLFGIDKWCKTHYDDIFAKLSKRSRQFLADIKPWKPAWVKAKRKKK